MMSLTHAAIATAGASLILATADPFTLALAVLGSQLPDLDTTTSAIGQICFPLSAWLEARFPHRTVTHSLLATVALTLVCGSIGYLTGHWRLSIALPLGHLLACFSDTFTKQGVQLFYPYPAWAVSVSNPRRRLKTGGAGELWVLGGAIAALLIGLYLATGGGITQQINQTLALKDGMIEVYNDNAARHHVYADIKGVWASDRSRADGRYFILNADGSEFIVTNAQGIYKTNAQIIVERLSTEVAAAATTQTVTVNLADEDATPKLQALLTNHPGGAIYLNGAIAIDLPEEVSIASPPNQLQTALLTGNTLSFTYQPIEQALLILKDQYATGTLIAKVISPRPSL